MEILISIFHLLIVIYEILYPLLFNNRFYDIIYILFFHMLLLSWILLRGECCISFLYKKLMIKDYIAGTNVFKFNDINRIFPFINESHIYFIFSILPFYYLYFTYVLNKRTNAIYNNQLFLFIFLHIFYIFYLRKFFIETMFNKYNIEKYFILFKLVSIPLLLYNIYVLFRRL